MAEMTFGQFQEEAAKQGFEKLPVGTYNVGIDSAETKDGKGSKQIMVRMVVLDGPLAGRSILNRLVPIKNDGDPNGLFFQQMAALGFGKESPVWPQLKNTSIDQAMEWLAPQLVGNKCIIDVNHQNYQGEPRDNVKKMKPLGALGAMPQIPGGPVPTAVPTPVAPQQPVAAPVQPAAPVPPPMAVPQVPQAPQPTAMAPVVAVPPVAPVPAPVAESPQVPVQPVEAPPAPPVAQALPPQASPVTPLPVPPVPQAENQTVEPF